MIYGVSYDTPLHPKQTSFNHIEIVYDRSISAMYSTLHHALVTGHDRETSIMAAVLMNQAKNCDIRQTYQLVQIPYMGHVARDFDTPAYYEHPNLTGRVWADDPFQPLEPGETWNKGRRRSNTSTNYTLNERNLPINPYFNYGIDGRGVIGRYSPNHAVDDGILCIMPNKDGKLTLHALGIIRKDNGLSALCGGFTEFNKEKDGRYHYTKATMVHTQAKEFIEELVSGSIELLPVYAHNLNKDIDQAIRERTLAMQKPLSDMQINALVDEITTRRKMLQIEQEDPSFLHNVERAFTSAYPCYAGPVVNSDRNTNQSWMETRLSWINLDPAAWDKMKGRDKFGYQMAAGDDAQSVIWHELTPDLMRKANGSHDAYFAFLLSSYALTQDHKDKDVLNNIKQQMNDLADYFSLTALNPTGPALN